MLSARGDPRVINWPSKRARFGVTSEPAENEPANLGGVSDCPFSLLEMDVEASFMPTWAPHPRIIS